MEVSTLGPLAFASRASHTVSDDVRIPERIEIGAETGLHFELAGPRAKLFFDPKKLKKTVPQFKIREEADSLESLL